MSLYLRDGSTDVFEKWRILISFQCSITKWCYCLFQNKRHLSNSELAILVKLWFAEFMGEKSPHCYSNEFTRLSKIEINCVILNAIYWKKKLCSPPGAYFIKLFTVDRVTADIGQYRDTLQWPVFHIVFTNFRPKWRTVTKALHFFNFFSALHFSVYTACFTLKFLNHVTNISDNRTMQKNRLKYD